MKLNNKLIFLKTIKRTIQILIGILIGFFVTCHFRSVNYENFKKDILHQLCSYRSLKYLNVNDIFHVTTKTDLIRTFQSIRNTTVPYQDERKLLLVGVMTAKSFIETRTLTIYNTWGQDLIGHILFFTSSDLKTYTNLPYVALPNVDDSYPPQKKSFLMFKFMHDYFGDKYKFFMRADDDVFVNVERLKTFLQSLNSSEPIYIGQTGVGNQEEFGQLNLDSHDNFCMGGPGVILSHKTLPKIAENVKHCLNNLYSTHEDVEIGRCLKKFSGISCTWSYDMQNLFYHNTSIQSSIMNNIPPSKNLLNALTIHPIKNSLAMKKLYLYFKNTFHQNLSFKMTKFFRKLKRIFVSASSSFKKSYHSGKITKMKTFENIQKLIDQAQTIGFTPTFEELFKSNPSKVIWKFFSQKFYSETSLNPKKNLEKDIVQAFNQNIEHLMVSLNRNSFKKGTLFDYHSLFYAYFNMDQHYGAQYILDFLMMYRKYQGKRLTIPVKKHLYAVQTFSSTRLAEPETETAVFDPIIVNVIVPLAGRISIFKRFVKNFAQVRDQDRHVSLTIVLFPGQQNDTFKEIKTILEQSNIDGNILKIDGKFSRGQALQKSSSLFKNESLLFFLDVDMLFNAKVLHRIRMNTVREKQVYFPIVFSQYSNLLKKFSNKSHDDHFSKEIDEDVGYWRQFGYGIVSIFKQDLNMVGGYEINIDGWGMEDVILYDRLISSNMTIFRAIDPDLIHVYHEIHCDKNLHLPQYEMCLGTKFFSFDSLKFISKFINTHQFLSD